MAKSFKELGETDKSSVLIVDLLNLAFRFKHQRMFDFKEEIQDVIISLAKSYKCGRIIVTADWRSSTYRKNLLPEYKANRKKVNQTEEEKADFLEFITGYEDAIEYLKQKYIVLRYEGVEADDLAAYLVKYKTDFNFDKITLISSDKDWDLLLQDKVMRWSYVTRQDYTLDVWQTKYEFHPDDYISFKCLTGDSGDNIPGVEGIGPKRATQLINEYGSVFDICSSIPLKGNQKFIKNINESKDKLLLNVELMDLLTYCDVAIGEENIKDIRSKLL